MHRFWTMPAGAVLAAAFSGALTPALAGSVAVSFLRPDRYTDGGATFSRGGDTEQNVQAQLSNHLRRLGERLLPPGQTLAVEILDIDLAGEFEYRGPSADKIRVLRDSSPPRITLRYTLAQGGRVLAQGQEALVDLDYLRRPGRRPASGLLDAEKALLDGWIRRRFGRL